jgi:hypothetical protein
MSTLALTNGDDHPEAAQKHLLDAQILLAQQRADGAAYLSGYVVECALKSLWLLEKGVSSGNPPRGRQGHDLTYLNFQAAAFASVAGARTARYFKTAMTGVSQSSIAAWTPDMRYRSPTITLANAHAWYVIADAVFHETIAQMRLDGVL